MRYNGSQLKRLRRGLGLTTRELARKMQVSQSTVCMVENGHRRLTPRVWAKWLDALNQEVYEASQRVADYAERLKQAQ